jgi:hypothetical protein
MAARELAIAILCGVIRMSSAATTESSTTSAGQSTRRRYRASALDDWTHCKRRAIPIPSIIMVVPSGDMTPTFIARFDVTIILSLLS